MHTHKYTHGFCFVFCFFFTFFLWSHSSLLLEAEWTASVHKLSSAWMTLSPPSTPLLERVSYAKDSGCCKAGGSYSVQTPSLQADEGGFYSWRTHNKEELKWKASILENELCWAYYVLEHEYHKASSRNFTGHVTLRLWFKRQSPLLQNWQSPWTVRALVLHSAEARLLCLLPLLPAHTGTLLPRAYPSAEAMEIPHKLFLLLRAIWIR